jgi:putative transposase
MWYAINRVEYRRDAHWVHLIVYHLVWTPKRRRPVLVNAIATECRALIERKCSERGWQILELAIQPDYIHLFVRVQPNISAADVVKECKGLSSHELRLHHRQLLRLPSLWTRSYFASTAGNVSAATIARYIAEQTGL